jgi:hypothetical protein
LNNLKKIATFLQLKIAEAEELLREPRERLSDLKTQLKESCPDDCKNTRVKEDYFPGSYLDSAYSTYHLVCDVCGKYKNIKNESYSRGGWSG